MSKIQKALQAMRSSKGGVASDQAQNNNNGRLLQQGKEIDGIHRRVGSHAPSDGTGRSRPLDHNDNTTQKRIVELSPESLQEDGLLPRKEDLEVITRQFRRIKRPILQAAFEVDLPTGHNANVIMIASALPGAGKSFCAFNLSRSIALERDFGSVLVDADVLKPGISRSFGLEENIGLIDYLVDSSVTLEEILVQTNLHDTIVIPAGRKHPEATELLASRRMKDLVSRLSNQFMSQAVIFDTPPLLLTSEAQVLAAQVGQIVMIIEARVSSQESAMRALGMLDREKPINAILNKSRSAEGGGYQSDDYGYYQYAAKANKNADDA